MFCFALCTGASGQAKKAAVPGQSASRSITVVTEPGAAVWIDSVLFGKTGADGKLVIRSVPAGNRTLRVRHDGSKEFRKPLGPAVKGDIAVTLTPTTDPADLAYQQGEALSTVDRQKAIAAFEKAISLRPQFPEAYLGLTYEKKKGYEED